MAFVVKNSLILQIVSSIIRYPMIYFGALEIELIQYHLEFHFYSHFFMIRNWGCLLWISVLSSPAGRYHSLAWMCVRESAHIVKVNNNKISTIKNKMCEKLIIFFENSKWNEWNRFQTYLIITRGILHQCPYDAVILSPKI